MRLPTILRGIHIAPYLRYLRLWVLFALIPAIVAAGIGYYRGNRGTPVYSASATLYVQQPTQGSLGSTGLPDIYSSTQLAQTYAALATQPVVQHNADLLLAKQYPGYRIEDHGLSSSTGTLQQQTPLIVLTATDPIAQRAADAANAASRAFIAQANAVNRSQFATDNRSLNQAIAKEKTRIDRITTQISNYRGSSTGLDVLRATLGAHEATYQALLGSSEQLRLAADEASSTVSLYSPADIPASPNGLHPLRNAAEWFLIVLVLGTGVVYGYEYLNDLPREMDEVETAAGAPVLGTVAELPSKEVRLHSKARGGKWSGASEAYRLARTNLQFTDVDHPPRTIVVTSPQPRDGKTTTCSNLALVFAEGGKSVTLIDGDLRRPSLQYLLEERPHEGLTNVLLGDNMNGHARLSPETANLSILTSGPLPPNPADLLNSDRMRELVGTLSRQSDIVLLDSPPVLAVADAAILATMVDGVVLVVDPNRTRKRDIKRTREVIEAVGGHVLGVIVNRAKTGTSIYRYAGYYSHNY